MKLLDAESKKEQSSSKLNCPDGRRSTPALLRGGSAYARQSCRIGIDIILKIPINVNINSDMYPVFWTLSFELNN